MSEPQTITNVRATVELTLADGTTKTYVIEVDNDDAAAPLTCMIEAKVDVHDVTDVTVDRSRQYAAGDRGTFKLNIAGRGPIQKRGER